MGPTSPDLLPALHTSPVLWPGLPARVFLAGLLGCPCGGCLSPCELWAEPGNVPGWSEDLLFSRPFQFLFRKLVLD